MDVKDIKITKDTVGQSTIRGSTFYHIRAKSKGKETTYIVFNNVIKTFYPNCPKTTMYNRIEKMEVQRMYLNQDQIEELKKFVSDSSILSSTRFVSLISEFDLVRVCNKWPIETKRETSNSLKRRIETLDDKDKTKKPRHDHDEKQRLSGEVVEGHLLVHTPFCTERSCKHKHHELLIAILNSDRNFTLFEKTMKKYLCSGWKESDAIPDDEDEFCYPILHWAAVLGKIKALEWLLDNGFHVDCKSAIRGETPLHRVTGFLPGTMQEYRLAKILELFTQIVDKLKGSLSIQDDNKDTVLIVATKWIVEHGCNLEYHRNIVKILVLKIVHDLDLNSGILDIQNIEGNTALHILCQDTESAPLVRLLLENEASTDLLNEEDEVALDVAMKHGNQAAQVEIRRYEELKNSKKLPGNINTISTPGSVQELPDTIAGDSAMDLLNAVENMDCTSADDVSKSPGLGKSLEDVEKQSPVNKDLSNKEGLKDVTQALKLSVSDKVESVKHASDAETKVNANQIKTEQDTSPPRSGAKAGDANGTKSDANGVKGNKHETKNASGYKGSVNASKNAESVTKNTANRTETDAGGSIRDANGRKSDAGGRTSDAGGRTIDAGGRKSVAGGRTSVAGGRKSDAGGKTSNADGIKNEVPENKSKKIKTKSDASGKTSDAGESKSNVDENSSIVGGSKKDIIESKSISGSKGNGSGSMKNTSESKSVNGSKSDASGSKSNASGSKKDTNGSKAEVSGSKADVNRSKKDTSGSENVNVSKAKASAFKSSPSASKNDASGSKSNASGSKTDASGSKTDLNVSKNDASQSNNDANETSSNTSGSMKSDADDKDASSLDERNMWGKLAQMISGQEQKPEERVGTVSNCDSDEGIGDAMQEEVDEDVNDSAVAVFSMLQDAGCLVDTMSIIMEKKKSQEKELLEEKKKIADADKMIQAKQEQIDTKKKYILSITEEVRKLFSKVNVHNKQIEQLEKQKQEDIKTKQLHIETCSDLTRKLECMQTILDAAMI